MANPLSNNTRDNEQNKFKATDDAKVAVRTCESGSLINFDWDSFTVDRTDSLIDVYNYFFDGNAVGSIEITYTDTCKEEISGVAKL